MSVGDAWSSYEARLKIDISVKMQAQKIPIGDN